MDALYIPQIAKAPAQTIELLVDDYVAGLETLTPVQGGVRVTHHGNYLEVTATADTIMTLTCDRCLQQYNYRLVIEPSELIWLQEPCDEEEEDLEREIAYEDLVETLSPQGHFRPEEWLYEQLCLEIPQRKLCDARCPGIQVKTDSSTPSTPGVDRRWASLEKFRNQL